MTHTPAAPGADDAEVALWRAFQSNGMPIEKAMRFADIALAALAPLRAAERERMEAPMPSKDEALCERLKATQRALDTMPRVHGGIVQLIDPIAEQIAADLRAALTAERDAARDALRDVHNYFWHPDCNPPIQREGDVQDAVERALAPAPAEGEHDAR